MTQAVEVSDDQTYYSRLKRLLDIEVFAYGGGGYGTLQEFLIFDKYVDLIKPDIVLWQFSNNDIINNAPDLEAASTINNNGLVRPYLVNGHIHTVSNNAATMVPSISPRYCRLYYLVANRLQRLEGEQDRCARSSEMGVGNGAHTLFLNSVKITEQIFEKIILVSPRYSCRRVFGWQRSCLRT